MKISFLCNSMLALPSAHFLQSQNALAGLATTSGNVMLTKQVDMLAQQFNVPFFALSREHLEEDIKDWIAQSSPDVVVVQTFPFRIPESCLSIPPLGFYNIHPSPLPAYRGPDPLFWQLANNEQQTGVTLHKMEAQFDTGPIFHIELVPVAPTDTYGFVQTNQSFAAVDALKVFISSDNPETVLTPQDQSSSSTHSTPSTETLLIDWDNMTATEIQSLIRASNPHRNGAITFYKDVLIRFLEVDVMPLEHVPKLPAGYIIAADPTRGLQVLCKDEHALQINILHLEEGFYSGRRFCEAFTPGIGDRFAHPSFMPASAQ